MPMLTYIMAMDDRAPRTLEELGCSIIISERNRLVRLAFIRIYLTIAQI